MGSGLYPFPLSLPQSSLETISEYAISFLGLSTTELCVQLFIAQGCVKIIVPGVALNYGGQELDLNPGYPFSVK